MARAGTTGTLLRILWRNFRVQERLSILLFFLWRCDPTRVMASSFLRFLDHTQRRTTVGRTPLTWSARRRDLCLITHNTHSKQTSMPPVGFEATISEGERPQTYALDRAATGTGREYPSPWENIGFSRMILPMCLTIYLRPTAVKTVIRYSFRG